MTDVGNFSINLSWYHQRTTAEPTSNATWWNGRQHLQELDKDWLIRQGYDLHSRRPEQDVEYHFRVRAENSNGVGPPLEGTRSIMIKSPHAAPSEPGLPEVHTIRVMK
ncbi:putative titin-like [Apostichopus japonicus]|uniref:Putative titin-like n=1 Tax=Stichopus japonicus TaxID=307972 RepID=A0A2G8LL44_STIJA|nr:putative titin-like [Apostichopus japonicus]